MTLQESFEEFLFQKRLAGLESGSINNYKATVSLLIRKASPELPLEDVSYKFVADYILKLYDSPISKGTASSYIRNIRIFLRWVHDEYGLSFDPSKIKIPKPPKKNVHIYSNTEIRHIFSCIQTSVPWITSRNKAIVALMLDSGLRQCEICNLLKADIDKERNIMKITGKGSKDRMVSIGEMSILLLSEYLNICPFVDSTHVFVDRIGNQLSGNAIRLFIYRLERLLPFQFSSHKLRHNFATNYCIDHVHMTGKVDVYNLSILMGHESIETTKKYEHFAHEIIAVENSISHLDCVYDFTKKDMGG